jgi:tetratricopeptide (TPR) repeat protein
MIMWTASHVETGVGLVAFIVVAILLAYRARLTHHAKIIKSALDQDRLGAIAITTEFFPVDVSDLTRAQQAEIALTQIRARERRYLISALVILVLAAIALVAIWLSKPAEAPIAVNQSGTGIASGRDTIINAPANIGLDENKIVDRIAEVLKPLTDQQEKLANQIARKKGVEVAPLRAILLKMGEVGVPDEDIPKRLDEKADELIKLREESARLRRGPTRAASLAQEAEALANKGDFDGAHAILAAGRAELLKQREQSARDEVELLRLDAAYDHLQLAYRAAAAKYAEAAGLMAAVDGQKQWQLMFAQASELYSQGNELGDNTALADAINVYRDTLLLAPRSQRAFDWAATQNSLGIALATLGVREAGTARLEEAITAYRNALLELTRERAPLRWALTQNNLGNALGTLGVPRLEEAVTAYRNALMELTRERVPRAWATTQTNLGNALQRLGERETGTARLEEAVTAYRDALMERTRERTPLEWAATQNNLGIALETLGARESGTARLEEAVAAYRNALMEWTRERKPLLWAGTQTNLGLALQKLGERESGTARLEEAVAAHREALREYTRERIPLTWAATQSNLGNALLSLGERETGTARLEEAVAAYRDALTERTRERTPLEWAVSFGDHGVALMLLAERTRNAGMAEIARRQIEEALETMRAGGHTAKAAYYEACLSEARAEGMPLADGSRSVVASAVATQKERRPKAAPFPRRRGANAATATTHHSTTP